VSTAWRWLAPMPAACRGVAGAALVGVSENARLPFGRVDEPHASG